MMDDMSKNFGTAPIPTEQAHWILINVDAEYNGMRGFLKEGLVYLENGQIINTSQTIDSQVHNDG